ncbi:MAG TPA: nuclease-related domain-containing protein, partial [Kofleriaceae bacterium]|nr:nuclease-related domain-containing protein [Kofleriaceae bacterium]
RAEQGVVGEELVGGELERLLAGSGCLIVNSLRFLWFGDIDHLVIGPGGITVIDAKCAARVSVHVVSAL